MLMSDELDKFDKHADNAMRRIVRAWQNDLSDDGTPLATSLLKVETNSGQGASDHFVHCFLYMQR